jgi:hypothetical protein
VGNKVVLVDLDRLVRVFDSLVVLSCLVEVAGQDAAPRHVQRILLDSALHSGHSLSEAAERRQQVKLPYAQCASAGTRVRIATVVEGLCPTCESRTAMDGLFAPSRSLTA